MMKVERYILKQQFPMTNESRQKFPSHATCVSILVLGMESIGGGRLSVKLKRLYATSSDVQSRSNKWTCVRLRVWIFLTASKVICSDWGAREVDLEACGEFLQICSRWVGGVKLWTDLRYQTRVLICKVCHSQIFARWLMSRCKNIYRLCVEFERIQGCLWLGREVGNKKKKEISKGL